MVIDKDNIKILLIMLIVGLGIGYAYINSDLNINGTAQVNSASWDVHWANIQVATGSVSGTNVTTPATITNSGKTITYSVTLNNPGDYYEFIADAVNAGTIDAMIDSVDFKLNGVSTMNIPTYLEVNMNGINGRMDQPGCVLLANSSEPFIIGIRYRDDINVNQLPTETQTIVGELTMTYRQAEGNGERVIYTSEYGSPTRNDSLSSLSQTYNSLEDLRNSTEKIPFLKHTLKYDRILDTEIGFFYNNSAYYLKTGGSTFDLTTINYNNDSIYYETNKTTLQTAFGSSNCSETVEGTHKEYLCSVNNDNNLIGYASNQGKIKVIDYTHGWQCLSEYYGTTSCYGTGSM